MLDKFTWYKQSTFRWKGEKLVVYIDSWGLTDDLPPADLILITHAHGDHYAPEDIARVKKEKTVIVAPADVAKELSGNIKPVKPGDRIEVAGVKIEAVPAYNIDPARLEAHPKRNNWVGYVLQLGGNTYYHAGDTDHLPELDKIRTDVAFLPIGDGGYVMTVDEAAGMAKALKPKIAVPMHFGFYPGVGVPADGERFKKAASPIEVKVFTPCIHSRTNKGISSSHMATTISQIIAVNPATEELLASFDAFGPEEVEMALAETHDAYLEWRQRPIAERAVPMRALARLLRERTEAYARLATLEMGKPIGEAKAEIEKCAWACEHFADAASGYLADEVIRSNARRSLVAFQPLGVVLAVMPWNFPFWQVVRFAAPALMAGNAGLLKHASNVPQCALAIEEAIRDAGFPPGLLRTVLVSGAAIEPIIADDRIRAVTLTGSSDTGSRIAELAGRALKKTVLELGGSDPFIVLADADLEAAAATGVRARNQNNGQSCIASKRFIVVESVADDFERRFAKGVEDLVVGDPLDAKTQMGPLARRDLLDTLERQVDASVRAGARILTGGERVTGKGYFFRPTVLAGVTPEMPAFREETFGPVAAVVRVRDADEAVRVANDSAYGLGASLWTRDAALGERLARRIESGSVFVNGMVASDPRLPFGGIKRSGYGRELSAFGAREFTNVQTIWIGPAEAQQPTSQPAE